MSKLSFPFLNSPLVIFLLLLFMIEPDGIAEAATYNGGMWEILHKCFILLKWITIFASVPLILGIGKPSPILWLMLLYNGIIIISCYLNGNQEWGYTRTLIIIIILSILTEYGLRRANPIRFLRSFFLFLLFYILINAFTLLVYFPDGIYINDRGWAYNYFLGYKNLHIYYFLPCILIFAILHYFNYGKLKSSFYALMLLMLVSSVFNFSTTSLLVMTSLLFLSLLVKRIKLPGWINPATLFVLMTVLSIYLILGGISGEFSDFTREVSDYSGKTGDTFEARTRIWFEALIAVYQNPIIGNGNFSVVENQFTEYFHMHNQYLDIVTQGGLCLYAVFCLQIIVISVKMAKIKGTWIYTMMFLVFFVYFIEFMLEGKRNNYLWYPFLIITYHIPTLISSLEKKKVGFSQSK